jgi:predicted glycogen debranching enzyme
MITPNTVLEIAEPEVEDLDTLLTREWLVTNGLGGYASGSVAGAVTRRYHGLLVAALPVPYGRTVMFTHLLEELRLSDGTTIHLGGEELSQGEPAFYGAPYLKEFRVEMGVPVWRYTFEGAVLEKRILMPHQQNTVMINYRLVAGDMTLRLHLRPSFHFLPHEAAVDEPLRKPYNITGSGDRYEVGPHDHLPPLRMKLYGESGALVQDGGRFRQIFYRVEHSRGYAANGILYSPGYFRVNLAAGAPATLVASTEEWDTMLALSPDEALAADAERRRRLWAQAHPKARQGGESELILAADQFIMLPKSRIADAARAHAAGDEVRSVIAGFHWFTDWGRDTMISLEGLTLATGRQDEARFILRTFSYYIRDGLIPNMFPEGENEGLYHTADATLWYFHAIDRYVEQTDDRATLRLLLPKLEEIIAQHIRGTRFGIGVDPADGLLRQGQEGYQLTWMDAKVDGWVVTPRRGKAVEINAL